MNLKVKFEGISADNYIDMPDVIPAGTHSIRIDSNDKLLEAPILTVSGTGATQPSITN